MAHYSGKKLYLEFDGVALSADHRGLDVSRAAKTDDTTAGADNAESHIVLTTSASFDLTLLDDDEAGGDAIRAKLIEGAQGLFVFGPKGNAAGKPCYSCQATVTSVSISYPYDKSVEIKATLTRNGDWIQNYDVDPLTGIFPGAQGGGTHYLLQDTFATDRAAGSVHDTAAEPGPGLRGVADTGSAGVLVAGGKLSITGNGAFGQRGLWLTPAIQRVAGRVAAIDFAGQNNGVAQMGLTTAAGASVTNNTLLRYSTGEIRARRTSDATSPELIRGATSGTFFIVLRNFGRWVFWDSGESVRLLWWDDWDNTANLYLCATHFTSGFTMRYDNFRVPKQYYAVEALASDSFNRDDGALGNTDGAGHAEANSGDGVAWADTVGTWAIASDKAVASALDSGVAMATVEAGTDDVLLEVAVTRSAGVVGAVLRYADGDNYLIAYHDGTNAVLAEVVGGAAPSTLITGAAAYVAGAKLRVHLDGQSAYLYYNDGYINRSSTVHASLTGTRHGLYTTDTGNTHDNFVLMARYGYADLKEY